MILFKEIPDQMRTNGAILAQKTAEYEFLDNMTKTLIAQFSPVEWTEANKERVGRMSHEVINHFQGLRQARQEMLTAKTYQEALQARFEWYRSVSANRRAEINLL